MRWGLGWGYGGGGVIEKEGLKEWMAEGQRPLAPPQTMQHNTPGHTRTHTPYTPSSSSRRCHLARGWHWWAKVWAVKVAAGGRRGEQQSPMGMPAPCSKA